MSFVFTSVTGMFAGTGGSAGFGLSSDDSRYQLGFFLYQVPFQLFPDYFGS
jgi:hypothetical protein